MEQLKIKLANIDRINLIGGTVRRTAQQIFDSLAEKPDYLINAGMYDTKSGLTVCDTIVDGVLLNGGNYTDKGFAWDDNNIGSNHTVAAKARGYKYFLGGSPSLVWDGIVNIDGKGFDNYFLRSAKSLRIGMGINNSELIFSFPPAAQTLSAFAGVMVAAGCKYAINLDGGGSVRVMQNVGGKLQQLSSNKENRANSTWLAIYLRKSGGDKVKKKVYIDAGHGGSDPGAVGQKGTREKDITLQISRLAGVALKRCGVDVLYSRSKDAYSSVNERTKTANQAKADAFVSIHCNSAVNKTAGGTETYAYSKNSKGYQLAVVLQQRLISATGLANRGVKTANFAVLRDTVMPAALIELAFISNAAEEKLLQSADWQRKVAEAIAQGICEYLGVKYVADQIEKYNLKVIDANGKEKLYQIEQENRNGTVWAPVRQLAEALGFEVGYDDKEKSVLIYE